jgi:hypothetical protein
MNLKKIAHQDFMGAIIGMTLGDGTVRRGGFFQASCIHEDYLEVKKSILENLTSCHITVETKRDNSFGKKPLYVLSTKVHPEYKKLRMRFYPDGIKRMNEFAMKNITPLGILLWYLDDGCLDDSEGIKFQIHSNGFSEIEHQYMQKVLNDRFHLRFNVRKKFHKANEKVYYWLYLKAIDRLTFWDTVIAPNLKYIPKSLEYKVPQREEIEKMMDSKLHKRFYQNIV